MVKENRLRGDRLRELREARGLSRERLAELLEVGTDPLYKYETEKSDPSSAVVGKIASLFNVSVDYLFGNTDNPISDRSTGLSPKEAAVIGAWRKGERFEAIKVIVDDEQ